MGMLRRIIGSSGVVCLLVLAPNATAAVDVVREPSTGVVTVTGDASADAITLTRTDAVTVDITGATSSTDSSCTFFATGARCVAPAGTAVAITLGDGDDTLDAHAATGLELTVDGGAGADTLRLGSSGMTTVTDVTASDSIDLAHADGSIVVRWEAAFARLVARCGGCSSPFAVTLPAAPGTVTLGPDTDDVDLARWPGRGLTRWTLGADRDRFFGASVRRSIVDGGDGWDTLVSRAAADTLRGGAGFDKLADLGGSGDVLLGGADTDSMASLDTRRDTIDGQAGRDLCLTAGYTQRSCDAGPVRSVETAQYLPGATAGRVLAALGIR